ncbi:hypothetical protein DFJ58DRAFT_656563 [Suillus subalutaceus]|uniref:uncharacterized protein n=1 Tax=Suillus subalutaceus TaxID=48586 RepID=UPI001B85BB24|nr:uncharacterized protein DFJ58DRAFT_656563 [Suillus subalutaceus]KAG1863250.1 hypothetical protein DFJ58DRAFT_656563 [Suillus subalutaceus]
MFNTAHTSIPRPISVFESNRRPYGWQPDKYEYMDYERRRNRLLKLPHVRVAVAQGGILWRICKQELASDIPSGPSIDVHFFADMSSDAPRNYVFDTLSQEEIDTLCGVYHVLTDRGEQTTILSWWPTPHLWTTSGLDMGYWTHSNEQVFQSRLRKIREGEATLLTARKWKGDLKFYKNQTRKFIGGVDRECVALVSLL